VLQFDRFASISIDKVRELKRLATLTHAEGRHKVFVLREADRMLEVQQNALLKLLEEPPPDTHLVLTSSRPQSLLSTIVSRCQAVAFGPLASETIARVLERERGLEPARAALAAGMADGSLGQALLLAAEGGEDIHALRDKALALLGAAERGGLEIHRLAQEIGGGKDRTLVRRLAHGLALWHGDLLRVRAGGAAERLVNRDLRRALEAEASRLAVAEIRRRIDLCEELIQAVDSNANLTLAVYWLLVSLGDPEAAQIGLQRDRGG
jgi:DNA polymerase-3 subunit delta'